MEVPGPIPAASAALTRTGWPGVTVSVPWGQWQEFPWWSPAVLQIVCALKLISLEGGGGVGGIVENEMWHKMKQKSVFRECTGGIKLRNPVSSYKAGIICAYAGCRGGSPFLTCTPTAGRRLYLQNECMHIHNIPKKRSGYYNSF